MGTTPILLTGTSHPTFAKQLAKELGISLGRLHVDRFEDGEIHVELKESVEGQHVFVVQSCYTPSAEYLLELCLILRAVRDNAPASLTAVLPFMCYRRQERKLTPGEAVGAELVTQMIEIAGATSSIAVDLHATTNETFFTGNLIHIPTWDLLANATRELLGDISNLTIVGPDEGSRNRASSVAHRLDVPLAIMNKKRPNHDTVVITDFAGDVENRDLLLVDDEICTANTTIAAAKRLRKMGANRIFLAATHPVLTQSAAHDLNKSLVEHVITTDTIPHTTSELPEQTTVVSVVPLVANAIREQLYTSEHLPNAIEHAL
ncbi:MAG: ribose-phosphate pyrophosphokinase [Candidatus Doudnabacteria bacterium]|nr:ribose-phosphate pyrophosphokinase [Candidatus Doudnabacteria bacterium]